MGKSFPLMAVKQGVSDCNERALYIERRSGQVF